MNLQRILLVVHHYPPRRVGGAELLTRRLAQWLARHGVSVRVLCIEDVSRGTKAQISVLDEVDDAVQVRRLNISLAPGDDLRLWYANSLLRSLVDRLLEEWQPGLVHLVGGYLMGTAPLGAARARQIPTVVTLTDFWFLCPTIQLLRGDGSLCGGPQPLECARCLYDEHPLFRAFDVRAPWGVRAFWQAANAQPRLGAPFGLQNRLEELKARNATLLPALNRSDAIISLTRFAADLYIANGVDPHKIIVKPDCLDTNDFDVAGQAALHPNEIHFGYFGQITPIKGVHVLVRAFLQVRPLTQKPMQLHIYGNPNAEPSYLHQLHRLASVSPDIVFHGAYEHRRTLSLMGNLDAVLVPSLWYENSPRVILEAFAARRPVIGTRVGGISEIVQDGVNGLLFERGNATDLARVLLQVSENPALLTRLAEQIPPPRTLAQDMDDVQSVYDRVLNATHSLGEPVR